MPRLAVLATRAGDTTVELRRKHLQGDSEMGALLNARTQHERLLNKKLIISAWITCVTTRKQIYIRGLGRGVLRSGDFMDR